MAQNKKQKQKQEDKVEKVVQATPTIPDSASSEPSSELENLKEQIDKLQKSNESLNDLLLQVADKKQLALYYQRNKEQIPPEVKLRVIDGKVVIGWRTVKDDVYKDPVSMKWVEKQIIEVIFEDGHTKQLAYLDFVRMYQHKKAKVVSTLTNSTDGKIALKVQTDDGKEYTLGVEYVN